MGERIPAKNEETLYVDLAGDSGKIQNRHVSSGRFLNIRRITVWPLMLCFFLLPWINIGERQSILFDLPERKFHILSLTFFPQDGFMLAWLLIISAFALFAVTNVFGRVWCGFTCPQTVWTHWFMWVEYRLEGDRAKRVKLDKMSWRWEKIKRRGSKYLAWWLISLFTGITFIGYFVPIRDLSVDFFLLETSASASFWVLFFAVATFANAGFLREQVCKYMCPYARFQFVMYDRDTLVVSYDKERGEARGPRKAKADYKAEGLGDCIDCTWCVQVCPVDIDIRDGVQYECINCGLCADACDAVMDKVGYARGLIKFTTQTNLEGGKTKIMRPRFIGYLAMILVMLSALVYTLSNRVPLEADVYRDRSVMHRMTSTGMVENPYRLKVVNMSDQTLTYSIQIIDNDSMQLKGIDTITVDGGKIRDAVFRIEMDPAVIEKPRYDVTLELRANEDPSIVKTIETRFMSPRGLR